MKFEKDIFISYAHIDDESLIEGEKGWITEFHRSLEIRLSQLLGYRPTIWRDIALDGNHEFSDEIVSQFPKIGLLLSVLTPRYVKSEWCVREVNEFCKIAVQNIGLTVNNKSRIFKIIKTPVDLSDHPEPIKGVLGYEFFNVDPDSGRIKEFSKLYGPETQQAYWARLDDIAYDICNLLNELKSGDEQSTQTTKVVDSAEIKEWVYLAETSYDRKEDRDTIKRMLQEKNYGILPDQNLPLIADEYIAEVSQMMSRCSLSIHIIGNNFGLVPEGTDRSKIRIQNEVAAKKSESESFPRFIWIPPDFSSNDERQVSFIQELKNSSHQQAGADLLVAPLEDLKFAIEDKLQKPEVAEEIPPTDDEPSEVEEDKGPPMVYLICDIKDADKTVEIEDHLFDQGFDVIIPAFEGEQSELRMDHQENLKNCDAVIIYYGEGNDLWIRAKTRDLIKIAGYGRKNPLNVKAVYLSGPDSRQKQRFRSHDLEVINGLEGFKTDLLDPFISKINELNSK